MESIGGDEAGAGAAGGSTSEAATYPIPELQAVSDPAQVLDLALKALKSALTTGPQGPPKSAPEAAGGGATTAAATMAAVPSAGVLPDAEVDLNDSECRMCGQEVRPRFFDSQPNTPSS